MVALLVVLGTVLVGPSPASAAEYRLDIDITHQVLSEVVDGRVVSSTQISTGNGEQYWFDGRWWTAETPRGWFRIYAKEPGWVTGPLGSLYNPMYFYEGYAMHGSRSVPNYPASHGCVRVTLDAADVLYERVPIGTPVFVHD